MVLFTVTREPYSSYVTIIKSNLAKFGVGSLFCISVRTRKTAENPWLGEVAAVFCGKELWNRRFFSLEWKSEGVIGGKVILTMTTLCSRAFFIVHHPYCTLTGLHNLFCRLSKSCQHYIIYQLNHVGGSIL